ncbi:hypothetical protein GCM10027082_06170 [Comamonas humi]
MPTVSIPAVVDAASGSDKAFRRLLYDLGSAASYLEVARGYLASRIGVTSPQYNMMMIIAQNEGDTGISINEIADELHVSNTFVTMELKKLDQRGLIVKSPNPTDARSVLVRLSSEGERQIESLGPELLLVNDRLFEHITARDFQSLSRIIASLIGDFSRTVAMLQAIQRQEASEAARGRDRMPTKGSRVQ